MQCAVASGWSCRPAGAPPRACSACKAQALRTDIRMNSMNISSISTSGGQSRGGSRSRGISGSCFGSSLHRRCVDGGGGAAPPSRCRVRSMSLPPMHEAALRKWITSRGGAVHDALALSDDAPCGARGVIAVRPISVDELMQDPLVCIPKTLHFDNRMATAKLQAATQGQAATHELMKQLEAIQMVAAALALERSLGMTSEWAPYVQTLPDTPPNAWYLGTDELRAELDTVDALMQHPVNVLMQHPAGSSRTSSSTTTSTSTGGSGDGSSAADSTGDAPGAPLTSWRAAAAEERARYDKYTEEVHELFGRSLGLSRDDVLWGLGHAASRSLGSGTSSGMVPYLDLLNHCPDARPPMLQLDDADRMVMTATNVRGGELAPLSAGDELYINYGELDAKGAWLKFGFVPRECT